MLSAAIGTCLPSSSSEGGARSAPEPDVTLHSGRSGRVAVVRIPSDWDGADDSGPWVLLERALRARVHMVILDLSAGRRRRQSGGVDRLIERLDRLRIRYAVVAPHDDETTGLGAVGCVYSTIAIARGTAGVLRSPAVP
ncbi:hypothetical protein GA707_09920 [Nostocoides sp. F2B08]|uniref:hypothetical protein n=1 Tax=Nostocoides sp. F2B08 TaxID=2653936 RepID=UPI00126354D5|nr:hypothetical protein [Tetrasphaera sp. F2B08]KAB7743803.1 hypothetical protein GA707_09920 [Tetrasphaera sp. F2B08]